MQESGHEIRERFADAGSGFDHQVFLAIEGLRHRFGHVALAGTELEAVADQSAQRAVAAQDLLDLADLPGVPVFVVRTGIGTARRCATIKIVGLVSGNDVGFLQ